MSVKVMALVWVLPVEFHYRTAHGTAEIFKVTAARRLILLALADHANDEGICWPSQDGLAKKCGVSRASVNDCLNAAARAGLLRIFHRKNAKGLQTVSRYTLCLPEKPPRPAVKSLDTTQPGLWAGNGQESAPERPVAAVKSLDSTGVQSTPVSCQIHAPAGVKSLDAEPSVRTQQSSQQQPSLPQVVVVFLKKHPEQRPEFLEALAEAENRPEAGLMIEAMRRLSNARLSGIKKTLAKFWWGIVDNVANELHDEAERAGRWEALDESPIAEQTKALDELRKREGDERVKEFVQDEGQVHRLAHLQFLRWAHQKGYGFRLPVEPGA